MFKTARMRKIRIVTLEKYVAPTVDALHESGLIQISDISDSIQQDPELAELVTPAKATPFTGKLSSLLMKTNGISELLENSLKLTGWKIDVRSVSSVEKETKQSLASLESIDGVDFTLAQILLQEGFRNAAEVADASKEELLEVDGITQENVDAIISNAKEVASKEDLESIKEESQDSSDLNSLAISEDIKKKLFDNGFKTIQSLALSDLDNKESLDGFEADEFEAVKRALNDFFRRKE